MFVYLIENKINNKKYVGQHSGSDLQWYWNKVTYLAQAGYQGKRLLYRAIRKYGPENFTIKPLVIVDSKWEMDLYEIGMIKALGLQNPGKGYNLTAGGDGTLGFYPDEETRAKMSKSRTGFKMSEENRLKFIERNKGNKYALGRKMTKENFEKLLATHVGAKRTEEAKRKMSEAHIGKKWTEKQRQGRLHRSQHLNKNVVDLNCILCKGK